MTGICGAVGKSENRVASAVEDMLKAMWRRGTRTQSHITRAKGSCIGIGICDSPVSPSRGFRLIGNHAIAVDGFFYDEEPVKTGLRGGDFSGLLELPGAFSFLSPTEDGLVAGRDPLGQKPLYLGTGSEDIVAFASLKEGLDRIGAENLQPVPAGTVLVGSERGFKPVKGSHQLKRPLETAVTENDAVHRIQELLIEAVSKGIPERPGIAFSGGLDSAIVAAVAKECGKDPELVTVGIERQPELDHAHKVAAELGLSITIREITADEVLDSLADVVAIVETADPVAVGVSIPFYFACRKARELGRNVIVAGQMSDELFGGYARFEELAAEGKPNQVREEMWKSVLAASTNDFEPGDKIAVSLGLEMRCPFAYFPLVDYALRLPLSLKVRISGEKTARKYILRRLASRLKLPDSVVDRQKKAVQYSSGVQKVLLKEAKRRKLSLGKFLSSFANQHGTSLHKKLD
ncbi:MAG TPA: asparagine synthetase B [Candidatus Bathyarchaeia archaeon]